MEAYESCLPVPYSIGIDYDCSTQLAKSVRALYTKMRSTLRERTTVQTAASVLQIRRVRQSVSWNFQHTWILAMTRPILVITTSKTYLLMVS